MKNTIKNFLTFGLYNRVCEAEKQSQSYYSELKRSIEKIDVDQAIDAAIDNASILTDNNFSPSDYDLVSSDDYDFDSFVTDDDVVDESRVERIIQNYLEDYHDAEEMDTAIKEGIEEHQGELVESMVKKVCKDMLVDWCQRTIIAAHKKQEETDSSSDNS
jgi:hypothetical protein